MKPSDVPEYGASGSLAQGDVLDLVHAICTSSGDGVLEVRSEFGAGKVTLRSGRVCHAQLAELQGEAAFSRIASATGGVYRVLAPQGPQRVSITKSLDDLLVETIRLQEMSRQEEAGAELPDPKGETLFQMVQRMTVTQKLRFAMRCGKEGRTILLSDPNRAVQLALISNPRITDGEVLIIARSKSTDDEILRRIAENREWVKYYPVRLGLAWNPKTPPAISTRLLATLMMEDVSRIAKSKDVPMMVAHAARRLVLRKA